MSPRSQPPPPSPLPPPSTPLPPASEREQLFRRLRLVHGVLGVAALPAFLGYHLWEHWPALRGPVAWSARAAGTSQVSAILLALVAVAIILHGCIGLGLALGRPRVSADPLESTLRPHQMVSGSLVLCFVVYHLWHVADVTGGPHSTVLARYGRLWEDLGRPLPVIVYVVGVSATCFHLALGLSRAASNRLYEDHGIALQFARLAAGLAAFGLWCLFIQLVAHFAIGSPLF